MSKRTPESTKNSAATPLPIPTAWCPPEVSPPSNVNWACGFVPPPGGEADLNIWCVNCSPSDGPVSVNLMYQAPYSPPPDFLVQTSSCTASGCGTPTNCSTSSGCTVQACYQPYPNCYAQSQYIAEDGVNPANVVSQTTMTSAIGAFIPAPWYMYLTVPPELLDLDIAGTDKVINQPHPTPSPIMVGQQVQLKASPSTNLTSVQWGLDSVATADVVANYQAWATPTPSTATVTPVATSGNPNTLYWVSPGSKLVYIVAYASNVQGPLVTGGYYPVTAPSPVTATASTQAVEVRKHYHFPVNDTIAVDCSNKTTYTEVEALSLGDPCGHPGIAWKYSASVPAYGAGTLAMVQLATLTQSGVRNNQPVGPISAGSANSKLLDNQFPLQYTVATGTTLGNNADSPAQELSGNVCSSVTAQYGFSDYFLYRPTPTTNRPSIWVTTAEMDWGWAGTASMDNNGHWGKASNVTPPGTPVSYPSTVLPVWTDNINTHLWVCGLP